MVESIYFLKTAWCGTPCVGLWPEQGLQPANKAFAFRRRFCHIGVDLGQKEDYTAIAVAEQREFLDVRHIERVALGTPYLMVVAHLREMVGREEVRGNARWWWTAGEWAGWSWSSRGRLIWLVITPKVERLVSVVPGLPK